jgi:hypothetical protein
MPEPLQDRFDVTLGTDVYTFRMPTIKFDIEVGYRAGEVRAKAYPPGVGALGGVDFQAVNFSRYCAILELYLLKATTLWPYGYSDDDLGKVDFNRPPEVNFEKFPFGATDDVWAVGAAFEAEIQKFRRRRDPDAARAGAETVAGSGDAGAQKPVRQAA